MNHNIAIAAYEQAQLTNTTAQWKTAALALYEIRRKPRKPNVSKVGASMFPTPWSLPKKHAMAWYHRKATCPSPLAEVRYRDGKRVCMSFWSQSGKVLDWDRAARLCNRVYGLRFGKSPPAIIFMRERKSGQTFVPQRPNNV